MSFEMSYRQSNTRYAMVKKQAEKKEKDENAKKIDGAEELQEFHSLSIIKLSSFAASLLRIFTQCVILNGEVAMRTTDAVNER